MLKPATVFFRSLNYDARLLFATRIMRLFAYGALGVVLVLYLAEYGIEEKRIGLLLTLTLVGDAVVSLLLATRADRIGRRRTLIAGAWLMLVTGLVFVLPGLPFVLLLVVATLGVISPSGNEVGPFLPIEQAALSQHVSGEQRIDLFGWYTLIGSLATAAGALAAGLIAYVFQTAGYAAMFAHRSVVILYALTGGILLVLFYRLSAAIEVPLRTEDVSESPIRNLFGLNRSRKTVVYLSLLFSLDAFGGGFIIQSLLAYWFYVRFGAEIGTLGSLFFAANVLAGLSALVAAKLANRIGLVQTMVFTHLPSNVLLILVPLMPTYEWAAALLLVRYSISQMDVPARQSYTMAVVDSEERSAAAALTGLARTAGAALAPMFALPLMSHTETRAVPFFIAGALKIVYDLLLWRSFAARRKDTQLQVV